jgi:hypothetical protein
MFCVFGKEQGMNIGEKFAHNKSVCVHCPVLSNGPEHLIRMRELFRTIQEDLRFIIAQTARKKPFIGALAIDFRDWEGVVERIAHFEMTKNYDGELSNERNQLRKIINDDFNLVARVGAAYFSGLIDWLDEPPSKILCTVPKRLHYTSSALVFGDIGGELLVITILSTANEQENDMILAYIKAHLLEDRKYECQEFNQ